MTYVRVRAEFSAFTLTKCIRGNKKVREPREVLNASLRSSRPREQPVGASRSYLGSQKASRPALGAVTRREGTAAPNELRRGKSLPTAQGLGREFDSQIVTRKESKNELLKSRAERGVRGAVSDAPPERFGEAEGEEVENLYSSQPRDG